jgi:DNA-binding NtrC family response regulator
MLAAPLKNRNDSAADGRGAAAEPPEFSAADRNIYPMATILIVDDEPLIRWSVAETLEAAGHAVVEAGSAREATQSLDGDARVAVVVLDLKLPDSSDLNLLRRILEHEPRPRVILMTAHGGAEILDEAVRAGAFGTLTKPFDMNRLVALVEDAAGALPAR